MQNVEQVLAERSSVKRIVALDSLRGLAALNVMLGHFFAPFFLHGIFVRPLYLLPPGHSDVVLFFVLSGYVLALPVWRNKQPAYPQYLLRRFFRIYVPYAAAVCLALIGAVKLNDSRLPLSVWFYLTWHTPVTWKLVAAQFLQMSTSPAINTAFWSLRYEMELSIVFPFLCWAILRLRVARALLCTALIVAAGHVISHIQPINAARWEFGTSTLIGSSFVLGALASWKSRELHAFIAKLSLGWKIAAALVAGAAFYYQGSTLVVTVASLVIILLAEHTRLRGWLNIPVFEYLGRISYSLYLIHGTVLFTLVILLYGKIPLALLFAIYLPTALILAHIFCILVEEPSLRLGRRLTTSPAASSRS